MQMQAINTRISMRELLIQALALLGLGLLIILGVVKRFARFVGGPRVLLGQ